MHVLIVLNVMTVVIFSPIVALQPSNQHKRELKMKFGVSQDSAVQEFNSRLNASFLNGNWHPFLIITDNDVASKESDKDNTFASYLRIGHLLVDLDAKPKATLFIENTTKMFEGSLAAQGRGMELSLLVDFNGRLMSCDDHTGVVYELIMTDNGTLEQHAWVILADADGFSKELFKCEWGTVKDGFLYIGGHGSLEDPSIPQYVTKISAAGNVVHLDWTHEYGVLANAIGIKFPGYIINEAVQWSEQMKKWVFLPRRVSTLAFTEEHDDYSGSNTMVFVDEDFNQTQVIKVGEVVPSHGFSCMKFVPGTEDKIIIALKSEELPTTTTLKTFAIVFDIQGNIIVPEVEIDGQWKFEGIVFV